MNRFSDFHPAAVWEPPVALSAVWTMGLMSGVFLLSCVRDSAPALMRPAVYGQVSIVGLLGGILLPFLISWIATSLSMLWLLYAVCFFRAALFGFCALGISLGFGSAGWLVGLLVLLPDALTMPALFWFCLRRLNGGGRAWVRDAGICCICIAVAGAVEICLAAPFLAELLSF